MTANDARKAHDLLDELDARAELSQEQENLLRSFLPDLPEPDADEEEVVGWDVGYQVQRTDYSTGA